MRGAEGRVCASSAGDLVLYLQPPAHGQRPRGGLRGHLGRGREAGERGRGERWGSGSEVRESGSGEGKGRVREVGEKGEDLAVTLGGALTTASGCALSSAAST